MEPFKRLKGHKLGRAVNQTYVQPGETTQAWTINHPGPIHKSDVDPNP